MRSPIVAGSPSGPHHNAGLQPSPAPSSHLSSSSLQSSGFDMPVPHAHQSIQPVAMSAAASPSFSVVAADYAVPRAILAPRLTPSQLQSQHSQQLLHSRLQQQHHLPPFHPQRQHPPINNPSVLHPVFFTNNFQRRQSLTQPQLQPQPQMASTLHPAFMSRAFPPAPPAPPLPHASSPVAHGYVYREAPPPRQRGNSKL